MVSRYFVNIEPIQPSGVVLTFEALPRWLIFGETPEEALHRAREALGFELRCTVADLDQPVVVLLQRQASQYLSA